MSNERLIALDVLLDIAAGKSNLKLALRQDKVENHPHYSLIKAICYGVCRYYDQLLAILDKLVDKRPKKKKLLFVVLIGLFELKYLSTPDYAAVKQSVELLKPLKMIWAKGLVNAVLRNYCRKSGEIEDNLQQDDSYLYAHPCWLIEKIKQVWPDHWQSILMANNQHPPMTLRVNITKVSAEEYLNQLQGKSLEIAEHQGSCITLKQACPVSELPGFFQGLCSVQDKAAQQAAFLLDVKAGYRVLDACAAPGGKTAHLLELQSAIDLLAIDCDNKRLDKVRQNLARNQLKASIVCGDATNVESWWDGQLFDRILLDAPCSATGVIRRQPDIKLLRTVNEIEAICQLQYQLLHSLWPLLKPGGLMLYATCSIMPEENELQIARFIADTDAAKSVLIDKPWGIKTTHGWQLLPDKTDGFYYALIEKGYD